ncbi:CHAT domain-containing protein [Spirosoma soli]|uniref:CHAT domain-containing protein n=1 Tax=Spirosoma soli TaxID=1770529 RepID=A0ABW5LY38_9BACT
MRGKLQIYGSLSIGIVCWLIIVQASGQCLSSLALKERVEKAKRQPSGITPAFFKQIKQELLRNHCPQDTLFAKVLLQLGYAEYLSGQSDSAIVSLKHSIDVYSKQRSSTGISNLPLAYMYLGTIQQEQNRQSEAISSYTNCLRLGKQHSIHFRAVGYALGNLSLLYHEKADYQAAIMAADQGIRYAQLCHDRLLEAKCLSEAARSLLYAKRPVEGLTKIEQAIRLTQEDIAQIDSKTFFLFIKAQILYRLGQTQESLGMFNQVLQYYKQNGQPDKIADVYSNLGSVYEERVGDYEKAIDYYRSAYTTHTNPYEKARMLNSIGEVYQKLGRRTDALATYQKALQTLPINFQQGDVRRNPAGDAMRLSAYKEYLLTLIQDKADTWLDLAKATNSRQGLGHALDTYQVADQMVDIMRWEHTGQQSKLFWRQKTRGMYERAIETCYQLQDAEQAFRFLEKSRAVMLADKLNELGARLKLSPRQVAEEQRLLKAVSVQQDNLVLSSSDKAAYDKARTLLIAGQDKLDAFHKQLEASNPAYYRYKYDNTTPSLAELQEYLKAQEASFVTYFIGDSTLYVLGVTGSNATLLSQPRHTYNQNVKAFMALLNNPDAMNRKANMAQFLTLGNGLYQRLIASLHLPAGRVIISPDGVFVPFEALSRSARQADYLVSDYAFSYAYSARLLLKNNDKPLSAGFKGNEFLGLAPVKFTASLGQVSLPGSDVALQSIAGRFSSPTLLTYQTATRQAFLQQAANARVIHLFTHAVADSTEREPLLYFADSTLRLSDLGDGGLPNAQLIVLAACKTGVGANQQGEGIFSLARGFAALGAPSILTTLWSVENDATYTLTGLFYQYLDQGLPKDIALQRAKQDWLRTAEGAGQLPNYWAGLIVLGNAEPLAKINRWPWIVSGIALLSVGSLLVWQRRRKRRSAFTSTYHSS